MVAVVMPGHLMVSGAHHNNNVELDAQRTGEGINIDERVFFHVLMMACLRLREFQLQKHVRRVSLQVVVDKLLEEVEKEKAKKKLNTECE